jgi:hypothetical protein
LSRWDFAAGIVPPYPEVHDGSEARDDVERLNILRKYQFSDLSPCLSASNDFMLWSEETCANLSTAWGSIITIIERFTELERIGNISVGICRIAFFERILRTADLTQ